MKQIYYIFRSEM